MAAAKHFQVIIVGGGIMGMLCARELSRAGLTQIALVDRGALGCQSSWAGGGIISPLYPWRYLEAITALTAGVENAYAQLAKELQAESGIDIEFLRSGLAFCELDDLAAAKTWAREQGYTLQAQPALIAEQGLNSALENCYLLPHVCQVRTPRLSKALRHTLLSNPAVTVLENHRVIKINAKKRLVKTLRGDIKADKIVVCSGAWSRQLLPDIAVKPVKGQMVSYPPVRGLDLKHIVLHDGRYIIPRRDGRLVVGSSLEQRGFDLLPDAVTRASLIDFAQSLYPALKQQRIDAHWAGLRPARAAGIPAIGPVDDDEHVFINAGHYRNGVVLAPASTRLLLDHLLDRPCSVEPSAYLPSSLQVELL